MRFLKKCGAALLAMTCLFSMFGCGESTANVMKINDYDIRAGIYIYYSVNAYYDAVEVLSGEGMNLNSATSTEDLVDLIKDVKIDGYSTQKWIQNKATEYCLQYVAILEEYDRLGLELSEDKIKQAEDYCENSWATLGEFYTEYGVGKQSLKDTILCDYKKDEIFQKYYGNDGSEGVTEDELHTYYVENNARVKYVALSLKDGEGNLLKADGKEEMRKKAEGYLARLQDAKDEEAMLDEFDNVIDEYKAYATSLSEAAVTTTDADGNTVTTSKTTTTTVATTTTAESTTDASADGTTTAGENDSDTTTTAAETTTTTTTTTAVETDANGSTVTTTTTAKFGNEQIIAKMTSTTAPEKAEVDNADDKTETTTSTEVSYNPSEKTYNFIYETATVGKPEIIEEDETIYIAVRLDIEDRMTEDDLWGESQIESVRQTLYGDKFEDMVEEWGKKYAEERNERAYKRYDPLDLDLMAYTQALYSNYYGGAGM